MRSLLQSPQFVTRIWKLAGGVPAVDGSWRREVLGIFIYTKPQAQAR